MSRINKTYFEKIKALEPIPYYDTMMGVDEIAQLREVIENNWLSEGPKTKKFQEKIAKLYNVEFAIPITSGSVGIYSVIKALGIVPGDEIITTALTCIATINPISLAGATPIIVDVENDTFNISPDQIEMSITPKTKAILPVHLYGHAANMKKIQDIADDNNLYLIEDACQSFGTKINGNLVGSFGDCGILSFGSDKTFTTGEGGMILTNSLNVRDEILLLRNHGRPERGQYSAGRPGMNFRITELHAGIGLAQLNKIDSIINRKEQINKFYFKYLKNIQKIIFPSGSMDSSNILHRTNILTDNPENLEKYLTSNGIGCRRFFTPVNLHPSYKTLEGSFPNAEYFYSRGLSLPSGPTLTKSQIIFICDKIKEFYKDL